MNLSDIPSGARVFVDAQILVYNFTQAEPFVTLCREFFDRVALRYIQAFTSADAALDVIHRVMVGEAITKHKLERRKAVSYLKAHPNAVKGLQRYKTVLADFRRARVRILDLTYREVHGSRRYRDEHGLLTSDSAILAVMRRHKLADLVTNDEDFRRVPGIRVWMPD